MTGEKPSAGKMNGNHQSYHEERIGDSTYQVVSIYMGKVELSVLLKRMIKRDLDKAG